MLEQFELNPALVGRNKPGAAKFARRILETDQFKSAILQACRDKKRGAVTHGRFLKFLDLAKEGAKESVSEELERRWSRIDSNASRAPIIAKPPVPSPSRGRTGGLRTSMGRWTPKQVEARQRSERDGSLGRHRWDYPRSY